MKKQAGFTLVELVVVLVIVGIMAAVAVPKFIDLKDDAHRGTLSSLAGALSSGSAVNYSVRKVNALKGTAVTKCSDAAATLQSGLPSGYTIVDPANQTIAVDASVSCTLNGPNSTSTTFTAIGIS